MRLLAIKLGAVAWPRGRDVHVTPTPRWGGLAMFGGVLAGVAMAYQLPALRLAFDTSSAEVLGAVVAGGLLVGIGVIDDRYDLDALTKFAGQITAAGVLVTFGVQWCVLDPVRRRRHHPGSVLSLGYGQGMLLTVVFTVVMVNAMNFVDGLDGLAAGIGLIGALAICIFSIGLLARARRRPVVYSPAAHRGGARRGVRGLPAAQLPPGPDLHGRLRLDADRADAGRRRRPARPGRSRRRSTRRAATWRRWLR